MGEESTSTNGRVCCNPDVIFSSNQARFFPVRSGRFPIEPPPSQSHIDPQDIAKKITPRTKAIIPVHMRGVPCDMEKIVTTAKEHGLKAVENCAQANGGFYKGRALGLWGDVGEYSLQHFKIITAGEGGVIVTNDKSIFERAAIYHDSAYTFWLEGNVKQQDLAAFEEWRKGCFLGEGGGTKAGQNFEG